MEKNDNVDEIKTKVGKLLTEISVDKKELEEIRKNCKHTDFDIGNDPNTDAFSLKKICKVCKSAIGYPTSNEMKKAGYSNDPEKGS